MAIYTSPPAACTTNTLSKSATQIQTTARPAMLDVTTVAITIRKDADTSLSHTVTTKISCVTVTFITRTTITVTTTVA